MIPFIFEMKNQSLKPTGGAELTDEWYGGSIEADDQVDISMTTISFGAKLKY